MQITMKGGWLATIIVGAEQRETRKNSPNVL